MNSYKAKQTLERLNFETLYCSDTKSQFPLPFDSFYNMEDMAQTKSGWTDGWLVVLAFNATLTAKVISWRSMTHMCFLAFSHHY